MIHTKNLNSIIVKRDEIFVRKFQKNYGFTVIGVCNTFVRGIADTKLSHTNT
jgi:hypothetical protein